MKTIHLIGGAALALALAACATEPKPDEPDEAYVGRQVQELNYKWAALDAVVTQAQADGLEIWNADDDTLSYIKLLCNVAIVGTVVAPANPAPTVIAEVDWALVPIHIANACKIAMRIATPVDVPEVVPIEAAAAADSPKP